MSGNNTPTPKPFNDELLSAYLDEQLPDEARARVESHLAENVESRQLLDELAAVSDTVRSLPKLTVDDHFTSDVLAAAERSRHNRQLAGDPRLAGGTASPTETESIPISVGRSARGWIWAALAVAAALLVMFLSGEWPGGHRLGENLEVAEVNEPADAGAAVATDREKSNGVDRGPTIEAGGFARPAEDGIAKDDGESDYAYDVNALETLITGRRGQLAVPNDAPGGVQTAKAAPRHSEQVPAAMQGPAIEQYKEIQSFFAANNIALEKDESVLVVQVDLTPEAARNLALDAVLLNNGISYEDDADPLEATLADNADKRAADVIPKNADADPYEIVIVDATPIQLHAAITEINNDRGNYNQLRIAPVNKTGETNVWRQYNRRQVTGEQLNRRQLSDVTRGSKRASGVQEPASSSSDSMQGAGGMKGTGGLGGGRRLGSANANAGQQAPEQTLGRARRFRVDQNPRDGRKLPEGDGFGVFQQFNSEQGNSKQSGSIQQELANSGELPLTQLEQQPRFRLGDSFSGEGSSIQQRAAQEATQGHIWAVFLLRVVPQEAETAAQEPADEP